MKKIRLLSLLALVPMMALLFSSCGDEDPKPTGAILTSCEKPTDWTPISNVEQRSMTVWMYSDAFPVNPETNASQFSQDDIVAAFVGGECRGFGSIVEAPNGKLCVIMSVHQTTEESKSTTPTTFVVRYWSNIAKGYYTSKPITFVDNAKEVDNSVSYPIQWEEYPN